MRIEEIDKNFIQANLNGLECRFVNALEAPFELDGLPFYSQEKKLCRLPVEIADKVNEGVAVLAWNTAGVQVRFKSDTGHLAIRVDFPEMNVLTNMPLCGSGGFDLYEGSHADKRYIMTCRTNAYDERHLETVCFSGRPREMREYTMNFPLYNGVTSVQLGFEPEATILPPSPFGVARPVAFYGSSITQGGCASHPGNNYLQILSRRLDFEPINLGFSGSARGELLMADVIAGLELAAFVLDYDHNAPDVEHLQRTHEPFFKRVRNARPNLPIIMISMPNIDSNPEYCSLRRAVIRRTYDNAVASGDRNVYFIDGETLFAGVERDACTVDSCHPNDLGFHRMANVVEPVLRHALLK